jgi:hypothetical protein
VSIVSTLNETDQERAARLHADALVVDTLGPNWDTRNHRAGHCSASLSNSGFVRLRPRVGRSF